MTVRLQAWPLIALVTVASIAVASCGGSSSDGADPSSDAAAGEAASGAAADDSWDEEDGPGIVTLRPVMTCDDEAAPRRSLDETLLPHVGGGDRCVVGPPAGSGQVFERDTAVVTFTEAGEQWVVAVDLRAAGQVVFDALAERCFARADGCDSGRMAIVLDDVIQSAPTVQTLDVVGTFQISGDFTEDQARTLARAINRGAIPVDSDDEPTAADAATSEEQSTSQTSPVSTPSSTIMPLTTIDPAPGSDTGFAMPGMCGLPATNWTEGEHPDSQSPGIWATGSRDEGDLDGDGQAEVVWATVCGQGTVAAERAVHVFDTDRRPMGTLPVAATVAETYPERTVHALEPRIGDNDIEIEVWVWQPQDASCCPSVTFALTFAWDGAGFAATSPVPDPTAAAAPTGEAPVVDWDGVYRPPSSPGRVVRLGEFGRQVELLQKELDERGYDVDVDGYFGRGTASAVRQFQRDRGLPATGVAGDDVWDEFDN